MRTRTFTLIAAAVAAALAAAPRAAAAQRPTTPRRGQTIEIRGQVPTPQVVTVRPRDIPTFNRQVLVPAFYDHAFWPLILPAYGIVPQSEVVGQGAADSLLAPSVAGAGAGPGAPAAQPGAPIVPAVQPSGLPAAQRAPATPEEARAQELREIRQELERHRARLDSLLNSQKTQLDSAEARARRRMSQPPPSDTTRRPPGTPPASPQ